MAAAADDHHRPSIGGVLRRDYVANARHGPLPGLLLLLTVVTALVDAVSILRMGRVFVANMTGNVAFIAFGVAGARGFSVPASLTALGGFVLGSAGTGSIPAGWRADRAKLMRTSVAIKLVFVLPVVALGAAVGISPGRPSTYVMSALLAASMGVQNATVRQLAVPDLTTTVLTRTLTALVADLGHEGWRSPATGYRIASVVTLFIGALVGAVAVIEVNAVTALGIGAFVLAIVGVVAHRAVVTHPGWVEFPTS